jgi:hypothetical protein
VLQIITEKPKQYNFTPGQATEVSINKPDWKEKKNPFTFTCLPENNFLEFNIKTYPAHKGVTNELLTLKKADELMHQKMKNSTLHIITHAGHLSNLENPGEFNEHLKMFFVTIYKKHEILHTAGDTSAFSQIRNRLNLLLTFKSI